MLKAVARASKFVKIWKITIGDAAIITTSHGRVRGLNPALAQMVTSHASANPKATMLKNITTSATMGSPSRSLAWV